MLKIGLGEQTTVVKWIVDLRYRRRVKLDYEDRDQWTSHPYKEASPLSFRLCCVSGEQRLP